MRTFSNYFRFIFFITLFFINSTTHAAVLPDSWPWHGVSIGFPEGGPSDIERYKKKLNINAVRLQLKLRRYAKINQVSSEKAWIDGIKWTHEMLNSCAENNVKAIVNISDFPLDPKTGVTQREAVFWKEDHYRDDVISVTEKLSLALRNRGNEFAAYDLMSEPVIVENGISKQPNVWPVMLRKIIVTIRKYDSQRWLVVSPGPWGGLQGYKYFKVINDEKLIYGVHIYDPHLYTHQGVRNNPVGFKYPGVINYKYWDQKRIENEMIYLNRFHKKYNVPVLVGEFGVVRWAEGGEQYIKDLVKIFNKYDWGWLYFSGTGWNGWNPDYSQNYPVKGGDWKKDYIGIKSERWKTLNEIFLYK